MKAFITTANSVFDFINAFENVRFTAKNRFNAMHVVALPSTIDKTEDYVHRILKHPAIQGDIFCHWHVNLIEFKSDLVFYFLNKIFQTF